MQEMRRPYSTAAAPFSDQNKSRQKRLKFFIIATASMIQTPLLFGCIFGFARQYFNFLKKLRLALLKGGVREPSPVEELFPKTAGEQKNHFFFAPTLNLAHIQAPSWLNDNFKQDQFFFKFS
jgi:hypothetical protein